MTKASIRTSNRTSAAVSWKTKHTKGSLMMGLPTSNRKSNLWLVMRTSWRLSKKERMRRFLPRWMRTIKLRIDYEFLGSWIGICILVLYFYSHCWNLVNFIAITNSWVNSPMITIHRSRMQDHFSHMIKANNRKNMIVSRIVKRNKNFSIWRRKE